MIPFTVFDYFCLWLKWIWQGRQRTFLGIRIVVSKKLNAEIYNRILAAGIKVHKPFVANIEVEGCGRFVILHDWDDFKYAQAYN